MSKHFSSWMFYDGPLDHTDTGNNFRTYSNRQAVLESDVAELEKIFPHSPKPEIIESLRICHGNKVAAADWIIEHNKLPDRAHPESTYYQPPIEVTVNRESTITPPPSSKLRYGRFACGRCSTLQSIQLPSVPPAPGAQISFICPTCSCRNVLPMIEQTDPPPLTMNTPEPHLCSWMFFNPPAPPQSSNPYSHTMELNEQDIFDLQSVFQDTPLPQIQEALRISHGDKDLASNWILAHNEHPGDIHPSSCYYHPPMPEACAVTDTSTAILSCPAEFHCGSCGSLMLIKLPTAPLQPGAQLVGRCPDCGIHNIIPLRKSRAVIF